MKSRQMNQGQNTFQQLLRSCAHELMSSNEKQINRHVRMFLDLHTYPMDRAVKTIDQGVGIVRDVLFGELHDCTIALR